MPRAVTREEKTYHLEAYIYTVLLTSNSYFTGKTDAPHQLANLWNFNSGHLQPRYNIMYCYNNFTHSYSIKVAT